MFKKGDRVRYVGQASDNWAPRDINSLGTVNEVSEYRDSCTVLFDCDPHLDLWHKNEKLAGFKFKIGDRIRTLRGTEGEVCELQHVEGVKDTHYRVRFSSGGCLGFMEDELTLVEPVYITESLYV